MDRLNVQHVANGIPHVEKSSKGKKELEKELEYPQNSGTKKVNTPRKIQGCQLRKNKHGWITGDSRTRSGTWRRVLCRDHIVFDRGANLGSESPTLMLQDRFDLDRKTISLCSGEERRSSNQRCGQNRIGKAKNPDLLCVFGGRLRSIFFNRSKC